MLALWHDSQETRTTDLDHVARSYLHATSNEQITADQTAALPRPLASLLRGLVAEYEGRASLEADCARDADKLEITAGRQAGAALHAKHGSWLTMAQIELAVLAGQCLDRRLADRATLERQVAAWQTTRNATGRGVDWRFTTQDARIKLKHLYPVLQ